MKRFLVLIGVLSFLFLVAPVFGDVREGNKAEHLECNLFPNPVKDKAMLYVNEVDATFYEVKNSKGHTVRGGAVKSNKHEIDFTGLENGEYSLTIYNFNGSKELKIFKI